MSLLNEIDEGLDDLLDDEEREEEEEQEENESEEKEEEEEKADDLFIESKYRKTEIGSSSMYSDDHAKKRSKIDIKDLVKDYVLPCLPAKSLIRFRAVTKEWNQWIQSAFLAHQQSYSFKKQSGFFYQQYENKIAFLTMDHQAYGVPTTSLCFLPESVIIKSSTNGLLLCQAPIGNNTYYICNPVNREWKELPLPQYYHGPESAVVLAFEPSVLNMDASYQLICPVTLPDQPMIIEVYSSSTKLWADSTTCPELEACSTLRDCGFYFKGTVYWETTSRKVLALDLRNKIYETIPLPNLCPHGGILTQMNEELCYIGMLDVSVNECLVKIYGGLYMSFKYRVKLHLGMELNGCRVLPCLDGNEVMILNGGVLYSYSVKDKRLEVISREGGSSEVEYLPYVNSLVSVG